MSLLVCQERPLTAALLLSNTGTCAEDVTLWRLFLCFQCYQNAILQCLSNTKRLLDFLVNGYKTLKPLLEKCTSSQDLTTGRNKLTFNQTFIHSFITEIYIAPLQGYYSEALPTLARLKRRVLRLE